MVAPSSPQGTPGRSLADVLPGLLLLPILSGLLYFLGQEYHQAKLDGFGIDSSLFPLSIDQAIYNGFTASILLIVEPALYGVIIIIMALAATVFTLKLLTSISFFRRFLDFMSLLIAVKFNLKKFRFQEEPLSMMVKASDGDGMQISADLQKLEGTMMKDALANNTPVAQSFAEIMGLSPLPAGPQPKVSDLVFVAQYAAQSNVDHGKLALQQAQSNFNSFQELVRERASQQTQLAQVVGGWQGDEHWEEWQRRVAKLKHYDKDDRYGPVRSAGIYCELAHEALQEKSMYEVDWHALEIEAMRQGLELDPPWKVAQGIAEYSPMRIHPESHEKLNEQLKVFMPSSDQALRRDDNDWSPG